MSGLRLPRKRKYSWLPEHHPSAISAISAAAAEEGGGPQSPTTGKSAKGAKASATTPTTATTPAATAATTVPAISADPTDPATSSGLVSSPTTATAKTEMSRTATSAPTAATSGSSGGVGGPKQRRRKKMDTETKDMLKNLGGTPTQPSRGGTSGETGSSHPKASGQSTRGSSTGGRGSKKSSGSSSRPMGRLRSGPRITRPVPDIIQELLDSEDDDPSPAAATAATRSVEPWDDALIPSLNGEGGSAKIPRKVARVRARYIANPDAGTTPTRSYRSHESNRSGSAPHHRSSRHGVDGISGEVADTPSHHPYHQHHHHHQHHSLDTRISPTDSPVNNATAVAAAAIIGLRNPSGGANGKLSSRGGTPSSLPPTTGRSSGPKHVDPNPHLKFTSFPSFNPIGVKSINSNYLRSEAAYTGIPGGEARYYQKQWAMPATASDGTNGPATDHDPTAQVNPGFLEPLGTIIIHPGSRFLRIGKSTDIFPHAIEHVIARKTKVNPAVADCIYARFAQASVSASTSDAPMEPDTEMTDSTSSADVDTDEAAPPSAADATPASQLGETEGGDNPANPDLAVDPEPLAPTEIATTQSEDTNPPPASEVASQAAATSEDSNPLDSNSPDRETQLTHIFDQMDIELRQRLKDAKRRPVNNALTMVTNFNEKAQPELISDHNDPYKVEWTDVKRQEPYYTGTAALRIPHVIPAASLTQEERSELLYRTPTQSDLNSGSDTPATAAPCRSEYVMRWPIQRGQFNWRDYTSLHAVLGDLETIWADAIEHELGIPRAQFHRWSAVLVIPDLYHRHQVEALMNLVLNYLGLRRILIQQEAACVTFGAGISSACIVDVGAQKTSAVCVEDGYCLPTTRVQAQYGGDDISLVLAELLVRHSFPYTEFNYLNRAYDWQLLNDLKEKYGTLNEADVTVQVYDFVARVPYQVARKYRFKVYDEPYLASMTLFYPKLLEYLAPFSSSTSVSATPAASSPAVALTLHHKHPLEAGACPSIIATHDFSAHESHSSSSQDPHHHSHRNHQYGLTRFGKIPMVLKPVYPDPSPLLQAPAGPAVPNGSANGAENGGNGQVNGLAPSPSPAPGETESQASPQPPSLAMDAARPSPVPGMDEQPPPAHNSSGLPPPPPTSSSAAATTVPAEPQWISQPDELAPYKLQPLDTIITHCISHSGPEDRCKRYYANIILVGGGCALTPLFANFLESRLLRARPAHLQGIEKIQVLPSPRDLDPRVLAWKGASVLSKLDIAGEMWIQGPEWNELGTKNFKNRLLFFW
ncbi:actin-like protein arp8 [Dimargaris cristalligena]|nr:actin-like protein arp8 [Dimargaris cristalligena]